MSADERLIKQFNANRSISDRTIGGTLTVTSEGIEFSPNKVDESLGEHVVSTPFEDILNVGVEEKFSGGFRETVFGGGLRDRLRIEMKDGTKELFVVNNLDELVAELEILVDEDGRASAAEMLRQKTQSQTLVDKLANGIAYIFGGIALLLGVLYLITADVAVAVFLLISGMIGFPPTRSRIENWFGAKIGRWVATTVFVVCWLSASTLLG